MVDLRHLRYFVAVAEELSFTRAAARLHMAQPPLSTQIRKLEEELGVQLFDRSRRTIRLTEAGDALLAQARRLLRDVDETLTSVRRIGTGAVGRLRIGFVPTASNSALPLYLRAFRARYREIELYLREMAPDDLVRAVQEGAVDVSFLYVPFDAPDLRVLRVSEEPLIAALPADHRLAPQRAVRLPDLAEDPFILPALHRMSGLHAIVTGACRRAGFEPQAIQRDVWLMQTISGLVAAGVGVALMPASVANLRRAGVAYRPLAGTGPSVHLAAAWRESARSVVLSNFLQILREVVPPPGPPLTGPEDGPVPAARAA